MTALDPTDSEMLRGRERHHETMFEMRGSHEEIRTMASGKEEKATTSGTSEPEDAAPAGASAESASRQDERTAFQEERRILLDR